MIAFANLFNRHSGLDVTFVGQIGRVRDDKVEVVVESGIDGERILVVVEVKIGAVAFETLVELEQFDVDFVTVRIEIGQVRM